MVAVDPTATVSSDAVALPIDDLDRIVARTGKPLEDPLHLLLLTDGPERRLVLDVDEDGARLAPAGRETETSAVAKLPAEALIRLVYGRLDPEHTPPVESTGVDLATLRRVFPGV